MVVAKQVAQSQLVKISLLISILVSLPKTIYIYNMISSGDMDFSIERIMDFLVRLLFFFAFSWLILQLNANWAYITSKFARLPHTVLLLLANIVVLISGLALLEYLHPILVGTPLSKQEKGFLFFICAIVLIILFFIARILRMQIIQHDNMIENERLKQENLQNELAALKNQIDPHFLFNSLNTLTSLVRENERASQFVKKLSFMYRYILQSSDKDLVTVKDELKFLDSYTHLISTRYRDRFIIDVDIEAKYLTAEIPPLALQLLVENAVKHNEISETNPLKVSIYAKENSIFVENQIRPRTTLAEGTKNGLLNLKKRYFLISRQEITVRRENSTFSVELPLNATS
ncbi:sensor histidine kinase [Kriegella aquimaris]|uniref:Histidine kinase n=1 Tax=Kriegella aquimaris TaxID=192904 RepID=A0A1G9NTA9_9FLAO|nr:histidine kinase [Kriegella aquimaris]SDL89816.1 Histidine kinase [Kriegella aquimaris]